MQSHPLQILSATLSIILFLIPLLSQSQNDSTEIHGIVYTYQLHPKDYSQRILVQVEKIDECGNHIYLNKFDFDPNIEFSEQLEKIDTVGDAHKFQYEYTLGCKKLLIKKNKKGATIQTTIFEYNENGHLISRRIQNSEDELVEIMVIEYDSSGRPYQSIVEDLIEEDSTVCTNSYDENGRLILTICKNSNESHSLNSTYVYKGNSLIKKFILNTKTGLLRAERMTYYENGKEKTWTRYNILSGDVLEMTYKKYDFGR